MTARSCLLVASISLSVLGAGSTRAWSVATGGTPPCHEEFTGRAYETTPLDLTSQAIPLPSSNTWRSVAGFLVEEMGLSPDSLDDPELFALASLAVGARAPDTDGHSLYNLESLRNIHSDPSALGQYSHGLRGPDDDYAQGDAAALTGARQIILELIDQAQELLLLPPNDQIIEAQFYLDFYGNVDLKVWGPMYNIGLASHIVQDTFSHTIRAENEGFREITHVMNYIDAISTHFDEQRDGLAHSETFDNCFDEDMSPIVNATHSSMNQFFQAINGQFQETDTTAIDDYLNEWMTLKPGCTFDNDFCGNGTWVEIARRQQTSAYLGEMFGCSVVSTPPREFSITAVLFLLGIVFLRFATRQKNKRPPTRKGSA